MSSKYDVPALTREACEEIKATHRTKIRTGPEDIERTRYLIYNKPTLNIQFSIRENYYNLANANYPHTSDL